MLLDFKEFFVLINIDPIFLEECPFPLLDIALMDLFKWPISPLNNEEIIGNEDIEIGENDSNWLHNIPWKMEIYEVMNDGILC